MVETVWLFLLALLLTVGTAVLLAGMGVLPSELGGLYKLWLTRGW